MAAASDLAGLRVIPFIDARPVGPLLYYSAANYKDKKRHKRPQEDDFLRKLNERAYLVYSLRFRLSERRPSTQLKAVRTVGTIGDLVPCSTYRATSGSISPRYSKQYALFVTKNIDCAQFHFWVSTFYQDFIIRQGISFLQISNSSAVTRRIQFYSSARELLKFDAV